jgi:hypothetical protein
MFAAAIIATIFSSQAFGGDTQYDCFYGVCINDSVSGVIEDRTIIVGNNDYVRKVKVCDGKVVWIDLYFESNKHLSIRKFELTQDLLVNNWSALLPEIISYNETRNVYVKNNVKGFRTLDSEVFYDNGEWRYSINMRSSHTDYEKICETKQD